ncbi:golvesin C-terminal-like domain-containing protein [Occultella gossypii]|uniref:Family 16 glycosylhydrolase n=1 Tax=Occultella gossypii TaxID=2800820 RepID=A0ABS7S823_9MICO|nr:family 16 glycosylhydrolase [Occultella gossypii]MBZ2196503.1 family 16 glycosylhydrolase [Occultella gossypii]
MRVRPVLTSATTFALVLATLTLTPLPGVATAVGPDDADLPPTEPAPDIPPGYALAWADEFDGTRADGTGLDTSAWYYREGEKAECMNRPENVSVADGLMHIALVADDSFGPDYTCGGVISQEWFGYGYYETRAQLWGDQGFHSAFWTTGLSDAMPDTPDYRGPNNRINEIDGFEIDSHAPDRIAHHSHWFVPHHVGNQGGLYTGPDSSDGYHTYGFEWLPDQIRYFVDGELARVQAFSGPHGLQSIWLTTLGYTAPVDETNLPGETTWDYFRYYAPTADPNGATPGSVVVDNGDPGYSEQGDWEDSDTVTGGNQEAFGFQDRETRRALSTDASATWVPDLTEAGSHEVLAWNPSFLSTGTTAAHFSVTHDGGTSDVVIDQSTAGQQWVSLGSYGFAPGTGQGVRVVAGTDGVGTLRTDAVMFTPAVVVDDGGPGYTETGNWASSAAVTGWLDSATRFASDSASTARWTPTLADGGTYAVYAWTPSHELNTAVARYTVTHATGATPVEVTSVDRWAPLGTYTFEAGSTGFVELSKPYGTPGYVRGDAVRFVPVPTPDVTAPSAPLRLDGDIEADPGNGDLALTWQWRAGAAADVVGYHVYLDGQRVNGNPVHRTSFTMGEMRAGTTVMLTVTAVDASGNESVPSRPARVRIPSDSLAPAAPADLVGEAANERGILYWSQNDEVDLLGYNVYVDGTLANPDGPVGHPANPDFPRLGYSLDELANNVEHAIEVRAVDLSGNESAAATVSITALPMTIITPADPGYAEQGTWTPSSVPGWLSAPTRTTNVTSATATWTPDLTGAGSYDVWVWVPNHTNSTVGARYTVSFSGGTDVVDIDQTTGGSRWILLGRYPFEAGTGGNVVVSNGAVANYLRTSAAKFIPVE